jgi:glutathione peroxidase
MFSKVKVNGPETAPLYDFLKSSKPGFLGLKGIKWNFTKFLIDAQGVPVKRFAPTVKPEEIENEIKQLLKK